MDASGKPNPGWPISLPAQDSFLRSIPGVSAPAPDPPQVGTDGTVYFGAWASDPGSSGILEAVDPSGRPKPGFPSSIDWGSTSNLFFSLGELAVQDRNYLEWLERTPVGRRLQREIEVLLTASRPTTPRPARPRSRLLRRR